MVSGYIMKSQSIGNEILLSDIKTRIIKNVIERKQNTLGNSQYRVHNVRYASNIFISLIAFNERLKLFSFVCKNKGETHMHTRVCP